VVNSIGGSLVHVYVPVSRAEGAVFELVAGESTDLPGIAVTPELSHDSAGYTGAWQITHVASGERIGCTFATVELARTAVLRLHGISNVRWERTPYALPGYQQAVSARIAAVLSSTPALVSA
jgi:hypothetical protein